MPDNSENLRKNNHIFDVNENEFVEKVIEKSTDKIILTDFWAPWCGPCKQLTPILEEIINENEGLLALAKINIDENQQLATQLRIQSIPTVYAFKNHQAVDAFQGVLPEKKIVVVNDMGFSENLLIYIDKIDNVSIEKNSEEYQKYLR